MICWQRATVMGKSLDQKETGEGERLAGVGCPLQLSRVCVLLAGYSSAACCQNVSERCAATIRNDLMMKRSVMKHTATLLLLLLSSCGGSRYLTMTGELRQSLSAAELLRSEFHVNVDVTLVSLEKGEIVGEDILRHEVKHMLTVSTESPGRASALGPGWINVEFHDGIVLSFRWDVDTDQYRTPGWGTVTVRGERFDITQGVLAGKDIALLIHPKP
jgi:hypothetical protein